MVRWRWIILIIRCDGYQVVITPMVSEKAKEYQAKRQAKATATTEPEAVTDEDAQGITEEPTDEEAEEPKRRRKRKSL
jgi:hypothetical protein